MNTTIYLIRHGEVEYQYDDQGRKLTYGPDADLSETGKKQIETLAKKFEKEGVVFDVIYTSPYNRAYESVLIIAKCLNFNQEKVLIEPDFKDIWAPGWIATSMDELKSIGGDIYSKPPKTKDQESLSHLTKRIISAFKEVVNKEKGKTVGIVGHGDPLRVLIFRLQDQVSPLPTMAEMAEWDYLKKGEAWRLALDEKGRLLEKELIAKDEKLIAGERDY